ncbi:hypothetical protein [Lysobacter panacisoli]|nr:hypothetical protein [Lysobacter panacisoli]
MTMEVGEAAKRTLRNISGLCRKAAKDLKPTDSLVDNLGYGDAKLKQLAVWQRSLADQVRDDGTQSRMTTSDLADANVAKVLELLLRRGAREQPDEARVKAVFDAANKALP